MFIVLRTFNVWNFFCSQLNTKKIIKIKNAKNDKMAVNEIGCKNNLNET